MRISSEADSLTQAFSALKVLQHLDRIQVMKKGEIVPPVTVELDPTNICNHRCIWCLDQNFRERCRDTISWETMKRLVFELAALGVKGVVVKGSGEPTIVPYLADLFYLIRDLGLKSALTTNGTLLSGTKAKAVVECCEWVRISVDSATSETHKKIHRPVNGSDFETIISNIRQLVEMRESLGGNLVIGYKFSVDHNNLDEIISATLLARDLGVDNISIRGVDLACHGFDDTSFRAVEEKVISCMEEAKILATDRFNVIVGGIRRPARINSCPTSDLVGVISANGHMYACLDLKGEELFDLGSILDQDFKSVWYGKRRMEVRRRINDLECRSRCSLKYDGYNQILEGILAPEIKHSEFL